MLTLDEYQSMIRSVGEISAVSAAGTIVFMALAVQETGRFSQESSEMPRREASWNRARNWVLARASLLSILILTANSVACFVGASVDKTTSQSRTLMLIAMGLFSTAVLLIALVVAFYIFLEGIVLRVDDSFESAGAPAIVHKWRTFKRNLFAGKSAAYRTLVLVVLVVGLGVLVWVRARVSHDLFLTLLSAVYFPLGIASVVVLRLEAPLGDLAEEMLSGRLGRKAALAIVAREHAGSRQVLMNRQVEDPYLDEWILLGGYANEADGKMLQHTANRRV